MRRILFCLLSALLLGTSGCGTLFFSRRIGKRMSKTIDNRVFYTDCFLCLLGVIPGVVAFILDYDNGTIYYTEAELIPDDFNEGALSPDKMKKIDGGSMTDAEIARRLSEATGRKIDLSQARFISRR